MKQHYYPFYSLLLLLWVGLFGACNLPEDPSRITTPAWQPEIAVPLVNSEIHLNEVLDQFDSISYLEVDSEGLLSVVYAADLFTFPAVSMVPLPVIPVPMFDSVLSIQAPYANLQRISLKQGMLSYDLEGTHDGPTEVIIRVYNAVRDGQFFEQTVSFSSPGTTNGALDLSGYDLEFTGGTLDLSYTATSLNNGQKHRLNRAILSFQDLAYSYVEGYLGQYEFDLGEDSMTVEVSTGWEDIDFQLTDPRIRFMIENSYGVPVEITAQKLAVLREDGSTLSLASTELTDGLVLNYPPLNAVGSSRSTIIELNKDNSEIDQALHPLPQGLVYDLSGIAHPSGDSTEMGFVTDSSRFSVGIEVEVPLEFKLAPYTYTDTFEIDLDMPDLIESAGLILITENGFPLELGVQALFIDANGQVLDSLLTGSTTILAAAPVDNEGRVSSSSSQRLEIQLDSNLIDALLETRSIAIRASVATTEGGSVPVRIYDDYGLGIKMGLRGKVSNN